MMKDIKEVAHPAEATLYRDTRSGIVFASDNDHESISHGIIPHLERIKTDKFLIDSSVRIFHTAFGIEYSYWAAEPKHLLSLLDYIKEWGVGEEPLIVVDRDTFELVLQEVFP